MSIKGKSQATFFYFKRLLGTNKADEMWTWVRCEFKKIRHNSVWCDEQLNHNSLKGVFTPILWLSEPHSTITELKELFHQDVTVSAGMEAGHFRSRSTQIQIKSKQVERRLREVDAEKQVFGQIEIWKERQTAENKEWWLSWGFTKHEREEGGNGVLAWEKKHFLSSWVINNIQYTVA